MTTETQQLGPIGTISGRVSPVARRDGKANGLRLTLLLRLSIEKVKKEKAK